MSKSKDAQAAKAVLDYLNNQNRPYSATDIFNNLHKEFGKTAVTKCLEVLAEQGKIKEKNYGKQKVYVADQSQFQTVEDAELRKMDVNINEMSDQLKQYQSEQRTLDTELSGLNNALTTEEAEEQLSQINMEVETKKEKLKQLKSNSNAVSPVERQQIMKSRTKYVKEWRKRKRIANDILGAILEGYPKSKKDLYEDIGIETDEEYKVKPPDI